MRRRALLRSTLGLGSLACLQHLAGCTALYGPIRFASGQSHLHDAAVQFVRDGLGPDDGDAYRARLYADPPETDPFLDVGDDDADSIRSLRNKLLADAYDGVVYLLAEARMPFDERFHLAPAHLRDPQWVRLAHASVPLVRSDATDTEIDVDADTLVATAVLELETRTDPRGATVEVYPDGEGDERVAVLEASVP